MTWLTIQSLPTIMLALALGLVLGWLIWARRWERTRASRREVLGHLVYAHQRELADRDSQLEILREQLDEERRDNAATVAALRQELEKGRPAGDTVQRVPKAIAVGPRDG